MILGIKFLNYFCFNLLLKELNVTEMYFIDVYIPYYFEAKFSSPSSMSDPERKCHIFRNVYEVLVYVQVPGFEL